MAATSSESPAEASRTSLSHSSWDSRILPASSARKASVATSSPGPTPAVPRNSPRRRSSMTPNSARKLSRASSISLPDSCNALPQPSASRAVISAVMRSSSCLSSSRMRKDSSWSISLTKCSTSRIGGGEESQPTLGGGDSASLLSNAFSSVSNAASRTRTGAALASPPAPPSGARLASSRWCAPPASAPEKLSLVRHFIGRSSSACRDIRSSSPGASVEGVAGSQDGDPRELCRFPQLDAEPATAAAAATSAGGSDPLWAPKLLRPLHGSSISRPSPTPSPTCRSASSILPTIRLSSLPLRLMPSKQSSQALK
mmetsp:Transcript_24987/g.71800  ORF Transcript_24987/g.71800 Transcript_24987/m.71800 type:complete len:314 (-) Transcript_24987:758-1699(-)